MSINSLVFLVNKRTKHINYAGPVPATYGNITGMTDLDYSTLRDLSMFGAEYVGLGFMTEMDLRASNLIPDNEIDEAKEGAFEIAWNGLQEQRADLIEAQRWRIDRNHDELALNMQPTEDIQPVLRYMQAIRDLPQANPDPFNIVWPAIP